jgi:hypothetical protein
MVGLLGGDLALTGYKYSDSLKNRSVVNGVFKNAHE